MEMALERVGLGAVFLAPNRRFMLLVWRKSRRNAGRYVGSNTDIIECLPAQKFKVEPSAKLRSFAALAPHCACHFTQDNHILSRMIGSTNDCYISKFPIF